MSALSRTRSTFHRHESSGSVFGSASSESPAVPAALSERTRSTTTPSSCASEKRVAGSAQVFGAERRAIASDHDERRARVERAVECVAHALAQIRALLGDKRHAKALRATHEEIVTRVGRAVQLDGSDARSDRGGK